MADLSVSAAEVEPDVGFAYREISGVSGQPINAGQALAYDSSDGKFWRADNDSGTAARKTFSGIALDSVGASDEPLRIQTRGVVYIAAVVVLGTAYFVSSNAGGICPYADLNTGDDIIMIGVGGAPSGSRRQYRITLTPRDFNVAKP